ncbi:MAG TPA: transglycosylase family protein [Acidimicrobiales bacterium]|nr:transglycosylase family protein [Acidimicrobiales bacterium]
MRTHRLYCLTLLVSATALADTVTTRSAALAAERRPPHHQLHAQETALHARSGRTGVQRHRGTLRDGAAPTGGGWHRVAASLSPSLASGIATTALEASLRTALDAKLVLDSTAVSVQQAQVEQVEHAFVTAVQVQQYLDVQNYLAAQYFLTVSAQAAQAAASRAQLATAASASSAAAPAASAASGSVWAALRNCESGGNYADDTGNGFYGAYQFSLGTWQSLGYSGLPSDAPPSVQDAAARQLQARSGWGQWPACSAKLGL